MKIKNFKRALDEIYQIFKFFILKKGYSFWYDKDEKKYLKLKYISRHLMARCWEGEEDILNVMQLKVEQMFYNLKKYGMQCNLYIDDNSYIKSIVDSFNIRNKNCKIKEFVLIDKKVTEYFHNFDSNPYPMKRDVVFINEKLLENGIDNISLSLKKDKEHKLKCLRNTLSLRSGKYKDGLPKKFFLSVVRIPIDKDKYVYYYSFYNQRELLPQEDEEDIECHLSTYKPEKLSNLRVTLCNLKIENFWDIVEKFCSLDFTVEDYKYMTEDFKKYLRGLRINLKEILSLRRKIRDLSELSSLDFADIKEYDKKRKNLYMEITNLMIEKGENWWD